MSLKIAVNMNRIEGAYGGGNQFVQNLEKYLTGRGDSVNRTLEPGLDIILVGSSRMTSRTTSFTDRQIEKYLLRYPSTIVVHRINTCDEAKAQDTGVNQAVLEINKLADHTVFVSRFSRELYISNGFDEAKPCSVIYSGADHAVFNAQGRADWLPGSPVKIVTHHWSNNYLKGFDIYERMDLLLADPENRGRFEFSLIGNRPKGVQFSNTELIPLMSGAELAGKLKEHHLYLTGARNEAGGNHYIEAMRCGLPVLYLDSGSLGEYCAPYGGVDFNLGNFEASLQTISGQLEQMRAKVLQCPFDGEKTSVEYEKLFLKLCAQNTKSAHVSPFQKIKSFLAR